MTTDPSIPEGLLEIVGNHHRLHNMSPVDRLMLVTAGRCEHQIEALAGEMVRLEAYPHGRELRSSESGVDIVCVGNSTGRVYHHLTLKTRSPFLLEKVGKRRVVGCPDLHSVPLGFRLEPPGPLRTVFRWCRPTTLACAVSRASSQGEEWIELRRFPLGWFDAVQSVPARPSVEACSPSDGFCVYLGMGTNLGDPRENLQNAIDGLARAGLRIAKVSPVYKSPAEGMLRAGVFHNLVLECLSEYSPRELLAIIKEIEVRMGRNVSGTKWQNRAIDIDILMSGELCVVESDLRIPHPLMAARAFVMAPLRDIAPDLLHPVCRMSMAVMAAQLDLSSLQHSALSLRIPDSPAEEASSVRRS